MQMRPQIQLQAVIKALSDVVLAAIDPDNKLAIEQGKLSIGLLALLAQQLPMQFTFDRDELARLIATAGTLATDAQGGAGTQAAVAALNEATLVAGRWSLPRRCTEFARRHRGAGARTARGHRHADQRSPPRWRCRLPTEDPADRAGDVEGTAAARPLDDADAGLGAGPEGGAAARRPAGPLIPNAAAPNPRCTASRPERLTRLKP